MAFVHTLTSFALSMEDFMRTAKACPDEPDIVASLWQLLRPKVFWRDIVITQKHHDHLVLGGGELVIDSIYVANGLKDCHKATILAATIGAPLPAEVNRALETGAYYRGSIGDLVGSYGVEQLADRFCQYLQERAIPQGLFQTLRYSPGYGDWALTDQPKVMTFLDHCKGEITLSENCLLEPIKSITAVMGWAPVWQKPEYPTGDHGKGFCNGGHNCAACTTWACRK